jgi:hypothetical protein
VKFTFKDMRSTHATLAYEATGDIRYVQRVLGHSDPRLTERVYAGLRVERMLEQADRLSFGVPAPSHAGTEKAQVATTDTKPSQPERERNQGEPT